MKWSLSSYSLSRYMKEGQLTQRDCIAEAKSLGFDYIEFAEILPHDGSTPLEYAGYLRTACDRLSMQVSGLAIGAELLCPEGGDVAAEIARIKGMVDVAHVLGAKFMRHDATRGDGRPFAEVLPLLAEACREIADYAGTLGITTMVENHGFFCQDSDRMVALYQAVNHPSFGLLADMGNFLCADEDPTQAVARVAPYAVYVHAKDFHVKSGQGFDPGRGFFQSRGGNYLRGSIVGHGVVDVPACLEIMAKQGYDGFVALEFEGLEDPGFAITTGLEFLKRVCPSS